MALTSCSVKNDTRKMKTWLKHRASLHNGCDRTGHLGAVYGQYDRRIQFAGKLCGGTGAMLILAVEQSPIPLYKTHVRAL